MDTIHTTFDKRNAVAIATEYREPLINKNP